MRLHLVLLRALWAEECSLGIDDGDFRMNKGISGYSAMLGVGVISHFFWTIVIKRRFDRLVQPYFEKYHIKWTIADNDIC